MKAKYPNEIITWEDKENNIDIIESDHINQAYAEIIAIEKELDQTKIKLVKTEKELNYYKDTISNININQEAKQEASGYGIVSLPKNAANGYASGFLRGLTATNLLGEPNDLSKWTNTANITTDGNFIYNTGHTSGGARIEIHNISHLAGKNIFVSAFGKSKYISGNCLLRSLFKDVDGKIIGTLNLDFKNIDDYEYVSKTFTIPRNVDNILNFVNVTNADNRLYFKNWQMTVISSEDTSLSKDQLLYKYPYINNTKSTIGSARIKSVGKNLFDGELEIGTFNSSTGKKREDPNSIRSANMIRVEPNQKYNISNNQGYENNAVFYYDKNKEYIDVYWASPFTTPENAHYINFRIVGTNLNTEIQLEKGTQATEYESYKESTAYIVAKKDNKIVNLNRVGDAADEIDLDKGELIKTTSNWTVLDESNDWSFKDNQVGFKRVEIRNYLDVIKYPKGTPVIAFTNNTRFINQSTVLAPNCIEIWNGNLYVSLSNTDTGWGEDYAPTVQEIKNYIANNPITLIYQLAEPEVIPVQVSGSIVSNPNGTIYVETITTVAGVYNSNMLVTYDDLPIKEIEKITKIDYETGLGTDLDVSAAVIAEDRISFTHPDLSNGDIVFFEYLYDVESTQGECIIEYYDSRYTIKDSVTGKFYKWNIAVNDGVPSIELVEV